MSMNYKFCVIFIYTVFKFYIYGRKDLNYMNMNVIISVYITISGETV